MSEKYAKIFASILGVDPQRTGGLSYQDIDAWDSVGHMRLVAALEGAFDVMLDTNDIIDFSSFEKGKEILAKYGVKF